MRLRHAVVLVALGCGTPSPPDDVADDAEVARDAIADAASDVAPLDAAPEAEAGPEAGAPTGLIIPLYTYPTDGTWDAVIQAKKSHPSVPILAAINPDSGPGSAKSADYATGITNLEAAGVTVIGYVPTGYGTQSYSSVANVESEVDDYVSWYPNLAGIFFDEMSTSATEQSYYQTLATYVSSHGLDVTVGNPGTNVPDALLGIFTVLVVYEDQNLPAASAIDSDYAAHGGAPFAYIAYGVASLPSAQTLASLDTYVRYAYVTDLGGSNPYGALPSYFAGEVAALGP